MLTAGTGMMVAPWASTSHALIFTIDVPSAGAEAGSALSFIAYAAPVTGMVSCLVIVVPPGKVAVTVIVAVPPGGTVAGAVHVKVTLPEPGGINVATVVGVPLVAEAAILMLAAGYVFRALLPLASMSWTVTVAVLPICTVLGDDDSLKSVPAPANVTVTVPVRPSPVAVTVTLPTVVEDVRVTPVEVMEPAVMVSALEASLPPVVLSCNVMVVDAVMSLP